MSRFKYIDDLLQPETHRCAHPGCQESGTHRAPISPQHPGEYQWLCLEHVKEFNKKWDYFQGRSQNEIESFQRDAFTGHRPTWKMHPGSGNTTERLRAAFSQFMVHHQTFDSDDYIAPIPLKDRQALQTLELEHPTDTSTIKRRYKELVKRFHPDRNPNDKQAEERFKKISAAYRHLIDHYCTTITTA